VRSRLSFVDNCCVIFYLELMSIEKKMKMKMKKKKKKKRDGKTNLVSVWFLERKEVSEVSSTK